MAPGQYSGELLVNYSSPEAGELRIPVTGIVLANRTATERREP
jgi:hypothetical protein